MRVEEERNFSKPSDITLCRGYLLRGRNFFGIVRQNGKVESFTENEQKIYSAIKEAPLSSRQSLIALTQIPARTFDRTIKALIDKGYIVRVGSKKTGHWEAQ